MIDMRTMRFENGMTAVPMVTVTEYF